MRKRVAVMSKKMIFALVAVLSLVMSGCLGGGGNDGGSGFVTTGLVGSESPVQVHEIAKMMENSGIVLNGDEDKYYEQLEKAINEKIGVPADGPNRALSASVSVLSKLTLNMVSYEIQLSPVEKTTFDLGEKVKVTASYTGTGSAPNNVSQSPNLKWAIYNGTGSLSGKVFTPAAAAGTTVFIVYYMENKVTRYALFRLKIIALSQLLLSKVSDHIVGSSVEVSTYDLSKIAVTAKYSNGASNDVTGNKDMKWTLASGRGTILGNIYSAPQFAESATFKATYTEAGVARSVSFRLIVTKPVLPTFTISLSKGVDMIQAGSAYDLSQIVVKADYSIGTSAEVTASPNLTWVKSAGRGVLTGRSYASASVAETAVFTATYKEYGAAKTAQFRLSVTGSAPPVTAASLTVNLGDGITIEMMRIPAGRFQMGSASFAPVHTVNITNDFYLGKYEVTQEQWAKVMGASPSYDKKGPGYPAEHISWNECQEFVNALNSKGLGNFRMPTEAEWEYACKAGSATPYYWGTSINGDYCWYSGNSKNSANIVGQKLPNNFGLYDMSGNVAEWCSDYFSSSYYKTSPANDPSGPASGDLRVLRSSGTGNMGSAAECVSAYRSGFNHSGKPSHSGFRLAMGTVAVQKKVEAPVFDPAAGTYAKAVAITIKSATEGAVIKYTLDGTVPSAVNGTVYNAPFNLSKTAAIKAIAMRFGMTDSEISVVEYKINLTGASTIKIDLGDGVMLEMVRIKAGSFMMGHTSYVQGNEKPQHPVCITKDYYIGKYEMTNQQWLKVMGSFPNIPGSNYWENNDYYKSIRTDNYPVDDISWNDCQSYIRTLKSKNIGNFRLPTEAEWEYACRAGTTSLYYWGDFMDPRYCWYDELWMMPFRPLPTTHPVGTKIPNAWGLYDMTGNVWEWCSDYFDHNYYMVSPVNDPCGPSSALPGTNYRTLRGGCAGQSTYSNNSVSRRGFPQDAEAYMRGFRLVMNAEDAPAR